MTQDITPSDGGAPVTPPAPLDVETGLPDFSTLPPLVQQHIKELREEAKKYRKEKSDAERQAAREEQQRLENEKQWETLAKQREVELNDLKPRAEQLDKYRTTVQERNTARINALAPQFRTLVPTSLTDDPFVIEEYLNKNEPLFRLPALPNTGAGQQGDRGNTTKEPDIPAGVYAMADAIGVDRKKAAEQYLRSQNK